MPLFLEGAIRGSTNAVSLMICICYHAAEGEVANSDAKASRILPNDCLARQKDALVIYWTKYFENYTDKGLKEDRKTRKADDERRCTNCFL
jgi:hypothetical protein